jgi:pyruvate kinase
VFDGTDALMLSAESAAGKYPVEAVTTMAQIIEEAESHFGEWHRRAEFEMFLEEIAQGENLKFHQAIAQAACLAAKKAHAKAIIVLSFSGKMALRISKRKPLLPILAFTPHNYVYRRMSLFHGVYPMRTAISDTSEAMMMSAEKLVLEHGYLAKNDPTVFCVGQTHLSEMSNTLKIYAFGELVTSEEKKQSLAKSQPALTSR